LFFKKRFNFGDDLGFSSFDEKKIEFLDDPLVFLNACLVPKLI